MEKLTVSLVAVLHGDAEHLADADTWEAETREELAAKLAAFLRETADEVEAAIATERRCSRELDVELTGYPGEDICDGRIAPETGRCETCGRPA